MKRFPGSIQKNYDDYLNDVIKVGFTECFPVVKILDTIKIREKARGFSVEIKVSLVRVSFGKENQFQCTSVVTDECDISSKLLMNGFGSHCHVDAGKAMERAVIEMCKKNDMMICDKICTWPFAKAIVQDNHFIN